VRKSEGSLWICLSKDNDGREMAKVKVVTGGIRIDFDPILSLGMPPSNGLKRGGI